MRAFLHFLGNEVYSMEPSLRNELLSVARGECPAELVLKHATIVDVCTESLYTGDIAVHKGYIAGVGEYEGVQQEDFTGKYEIGRAHV